MGREYMKMGAAAALALLLALGALVLGTGTAEALPQYSYDCKFCHQMPPKDSGTPKKNPFTGGVPGNHKGHATDQVSSCVPCHGGDVASYGGAHRNKVIELDETIKYSLKRPGVFLNQTSVPPNPLGTCAVACHSDGRNGGTAFSPVWGSDPTLTDCSTCHGASPNTGSHFLKHAAYFGTSASACAKCHSDHGSEARPFDHATSAMHATKRAIDVRFTATPDSEAGQFTGGKCSNIYCHSDGRKNYRDVDWAMGTTVDCAGCHGAATTTGTYALSGKHGKHLDNQLALGSNYVCADCHAGVVSGNSSIIEPSLHVNHNVELAGGVKLGTVNSGTCSSSYCHSDGKNTFRTVTWTQIQDIGCNGCHGTSNGTGAPDYATEGGGLLKANNHDKHVTSSNDCVNCHSKTMNGAGALIAGGQHIDGFNNFTSGNGTTFGKLANKTCSNISCHRGNNVVQNVAPAQWGAHLDCLGCHSTLTPGHTAHSGLYGCVDCHAGVVSSNTVISTPAKHLNNTADVAGTTLTSYTPPTDYSLADATCTTSCHMSTTPKWNVPSTGQCGSCHAAFSPVIGTLGHAAHFTAQNGPQMTQDATGCQICHVYNGERVAPHATGGLADMKPGYTANGACAQCHRATSTRWDTANTVTCDSCHNSTVAPLSFISNVTAADVKNAGRNGHGRSGINKTCADCHDKNSAHINGVTGDKRLVSALGTGTDNNECNYCHSDAGKVSEKNLNIRTHRSTGLGYLCADCHNVHGTDTNTMMVKENIAGTTVSFTGNNTFANGGRTGVCQVCHTYTRFFTKAGQPQSNHGDSTQNCLTCHSHNPTTGFAFSANGACDACHGYPPAPAKTLTAQIYGVLGSWSSAKLENYSGGGGAHTIEGHVPKDLRLTKTDADWAPCLPCHFDADKAHARSVPLRDNVQNVTVTLDPQYRFSNDYYFVYSSAKLVNGGANKTGTCFNVSCHMGPTPQWSIER
jgi:predicted CxxxxCH...CXXCH cytochrome family protein